MNTLKIRNMMKSSKETIDCIKSKLSMVALNACAGVGIIQYDNNGDAITNEIVNKVNNVKNMILAIVAAAGTIYLIFSILKAAKGHKNGDDRQFDQGLTGIIVSIALMMISTLVGIFS